MSQSPRTGPEAAPQTAPQTAPHTASETAPVRRVPGSVWVLLPQAASRLSAVYVFAVAASQVDAAQLGVLAIATAITGASFGLAPAVVGKPLAVLPPGPQLVERAAAAQSFALAVAALVGLGLAVAAVLSGGSVRLALLGAAVGVPAAMVVESQYWRTVFVRGRQHAGLVLASAFLCQAVAVTVAALFLSPTAVVLSPFVGLALPAAALLAATRGLTLAGVRAWGGPLRSTWLPYVAGVAAAVTLLQAVPVVLAATAGLPAASTYRAGELVFGVTNLLIGVVTQTFLTQDTPDVPRAYRRAGTALAVAAAVNGLAVLLLPDRLLARVVGPVAPALHDLLPLFTLQRAALGVAYVGSILLLRTLTARRAGTFGVAGAALNLVLLLAGAALGGVAGGVAGLALAELIVAVVYVRLARRTA